MINFITLTLSLQIWFRAFLYLSNESLFCIMFCKSISCILSPYKIRLSHFYFTLIKCFSLWICCIEKVPMLYFHHLRILWKNAWRSFIMFIGVVCLFDLTKSKPPSDLFFLLPVKVTNHIRIQWPSPSSHIKPESILFPKDEKLFEHI